MRRRLRWAAILAASTLVAGFPNGLAVAAPNPGDHGLSLVGRAEPDLRPVLESVAMAYHRAWMQAQQNPDDFGYPVLDRAGQHVLLSPVTATGKAVAGESARPAERTFGRLERIKHELINWRRDGIQDADAIYQTERDEQNNRVIVTTDRHSDALLAAIAKRYGTQAVAVRIDPARPQISLQSGSRSGDWSPFFGGASIGTCTTGFPWYYGGTYAMVTAGHCFPDGGLMRTSAPQSIGTVTSGVQENFNSIFGTDYFPGESVYRGDLAIASVATNRSADPFIYRGAPGSTARAAVRDIADRSSLPGDVYCTGGSVSGELCGWTVTEVAVDHWDSVHNVAALNVNKGQRSGACTQSGDSGAPVYVLGGDGRVTAKGIHNGGSSSPTGNPCIEYYTDIWNAYLGFPGNLLTDSTVMQGAGPAMMYDLGSSSAKIFQWNSSNSSFPRGTDWSSTGYATALVGDRMAAGDFDGDGFDDIAVAYDYGSDFRYHVFLHGNQYTGPAGWYDSGPFDLARVAGRMVAGNWNGDQFDDLAMVFDLGGGNTRVYLWVSDGSSFHHWTDWDAPAGLSTANMADRVAAADVDGNGMDDIVFAYDIGTSFQFLVLNNGTSWDPSRNVWYTSGSFAVENVGARFVLGDWDGDGDAEPAMFYDYGGGHSRLFRWNSTGSSFNLQSGYESASGYSLSLVGDRMAADDVNGDDRDDIVTAYDYGPDFRYHVFLDGASYRGDAGWYDSGTFELNNVSDRMVLGRW